LRYISFYIGFLRSQVIPESLRANIMNWFRVSFLFLKIIESPHHCSNNQTDKYFIQVPLNVITCTVLYLLHRNDDSIHKTPRGDQNAFIFNIVLGLIGFIAAINFKKRFVDKSKDQHGSQEFTITVDDEKKGQDSIMHHET